MTAPETAGLDQIRHALTVRADLCKTFADALRNQTSEAARLAFGRARAQRVAYYEAIKLVDELRDTGGIRQWRDGGSDGLIDVLEVPHAESVARLGPIPRYELKPTVDGTVDFSRLLVDTGLCSSLQEAAVCVSLGDISIGEQIAPWNGFVDARALNGKVLARRDSKKRAVEIVVFQF